ncbi:hypothetical protein [Lysinibacillus sp. JNUCC 51]|uniref:hypothetical protein n=1 Tax=Lysinibacillus sp. JNUCC-51 TaxID=2792479 RepID=UPI001934C3EA|nr:hypothetical protein JNUCC51_19465 [Lysinibacillus sp. JNUCC-51]
MEFKIREDIVELVHSAVVRQFAKDNGVDSKGNKEVIFKNIENAVNAGSLEVDVVRDFLRNELWYGKNKHNFFIEIDPETFEEFISKEKLLGYFEDRGIHPFNNIDRINQPASPTLSRFEYETSEEDDDIVTKVYLGYIEKNYLMFFEEKQSLFDPVNTYICIEMDFIKNILTLRTRSQASIKEDENMKSQVISSNYLAKKYLERMKDEFELEFLDGATEEMKSVMYRIEQELTNFVELLFKPEVENHLELIEGFTQQIAGNLKLPSNNNPINLTDRIVGLLERALIMKDEDIISVYVVGKKGYVNMFDFRDDRGGRINARSEERGTPIQTSDIFFDTRETISEVKLLDNLWVVWFKEVSASTEAVQSELDFDDEVDGETMLSVEPKEEDEKKVIRIKTKLGTYTGFYKVEFNRYLIKEEYEHVLSLIESFK